MRKDFICTGCVKGPCKVSEDEVRPVLVDYCKSYYPSSTWWKHYDFTRVY